MTDPYAPPAAPIENPEELRPPTPGKPWRAITLSLVAVGAGHVYAGRPLRGLRWYAGLALAVLLSGALAPPSYRAFGLTGLVLTPVVPAGVYLAAARDAGRVAPSRPRRFATWLVLAGLLAFWLARVPIPLLLRRFFVEAFRIPAGSCIPTLTVGDHIFVDKLAPRSRAARRGDLVVFPFPEHPQQEFVKRVVALPGDTVRVDGARLYINGWEVPHCTVGHWKYQDLESGPHEGTVAMEFLGNSAYLVFDDTVGPVWPAAEWHVADGEVFVLGDNRNNSHDSRMWFGGRGGGVPIRTVAGFALTIWLSQNADGVVDYSRLGADLTGRHPLPLPGLEEGAARCLATRPTGMVGPPS